MVFCNNMLQLDIVHLDERHNPYFNRWFSAMNSKNCLTMPIVCHNPYFNRWFSAIAEVAMDVFVHQKSQSLF